ncbi:MAG: inositol monophosphatase family protein [Actinomycetota bacterium]
MTSRILPVSDLAALDDHRLAAALAAEAGDALQGLRNRASLLDWAPWELGDEGDMAAHHLLMDRLTEARPDDAVLSEEGRDNRNRLTADRTWIVDPLDGSYDYSSVSSRDYAVHVALVSDGQPIAGAVSLPAIGEVYATDTAEAKDPERTAPVIISGRSVARWGMAIASVLGGSAIIAGSAGVKAMAVVSGEADVYLHPSGLYEWDACAPGAVATAAGLEVCDLEGRPIEYNKDYPVVRGLIVARPRFLGPVLDALR